ncbi:MAG: WXG100 family type VII secretion target [Deltaproteobacteria bacterium]|jgi:WXG100 family type VII secretion target|nr:WXG100 family type VII secretion target [Deltaproteobacteria bacterium]
MAIKFDYNRTMAQAKSLDQIADDMRTKACRKLTEILETAQAAWTGQAADSFIKLFIGFRDDFIKSAKFLSDTANFLRDAAKRLRAADEAAKQASERI